MSSAGEVAIFNKTSKEGKTTPSPSQESALAAAALCFHFSLISRSKSCSASQNTSGKTSCILGRRESPPELVKNETLLFMINIFNSSRQAKRTASTRHNTHFAEKSLPGRESTMKERNLSAASPFLCIHVACGNSLFK